MNQKNITLLRCHRIELGQVSAKSVAGHRMVPWVANCVALKETRATSWSGLRVSMARAQVRPSYEDRRSDDPRYRRHRLLMVVVVGGDSDEGAHRARHLGVLISLGHRIGGAAGKGVHGSREASSGWPRLGEAMRGGVVRRRLCWAWNARGRDQTACARQMGTLDRRQGLGAMTEWKRGRRMGRRMIRQDSGRTRGWGRMELGG